MTTARASNTAASGRHSLLLWVDRGLESLWLLTVFLVPLAFVNLGYVLVEGDGFVALPKVAVLRVLVALLLSLWLLRWAIASGLNSRSGPRSSLGL
ncbi:MAG: hypothetical protein ACE5Q6_22330, partial [Dehalococcoidia bacterium]